MRPVESRTLDSVRSPRATTGIIASGRGGVHVDAGVMQPDPHELLINISSYVHPNGRGEIGDGGGSRYWSYETTHMTSVNDNIERIVVAPTALSDSSYRFVDEI